MGESRKYSPSSILVETVLRAVYGRGSVTGKRNYEVEVGDGVSQILGSYVANPVVNDSAVLSSDDGTKKVKVTGSYDLYLWLMGKGDTFVTKTTLYFAEEIPVSGSFGTSYRNEVASARLSGDPVCETLMLVQSKSGKSAVQVEVSQTYSAEVVGDARLLVHASPLAEEVRSVAPVWPMPNDPEEDR